MEAIEKKPVVYSLQYALDIEEIYQFGIDTFGEFIAQRYEAILDSLTLELSYNYHIYPECRWLPTKDRIYRNIILDTHLIIYRISERIEVLRILHSHSSITRIRSSRSIRI